MRLYRSSSCSLTEGCSLAAACSRSSMVSSSAELPSSSPEGRQGRVRPEPTLAEEPRPGLCLGRREPWGGTFLLSCPSEMQGRACLPLALWSPLGLASGLTFLQVSNPAFEGSCHGVRAERIEVRTCQLGRAAIQHAHQAHRGLQLEPVTPIPDMLELASPPLQSLTDRHTFPGHPKAQLFAKAYLRVMALRTRSWEARSSLAPTNTSLSNLQRQKR